MDSHICHPTISSQILPDCGTPERSDVVCKGIIIFQEAEELVQAFRLGYGDFPFIIIPSASPLEVLRQERPFLLLAVLVVASRKQHKLQDALEREFRRSLSAKVIMEGARNLDLLQGLLIYLAWYVRNSRSCHDSSIEVD